MMDELTASVAHELNQPLSAIRTNAHAARRLLASETPDLREVRDALDDIVRDDARAVEIVQNVRALFQRKASEKSPLDLGAVLHEVERIVRHDAASNQVSLKFEVSPSLPIVLGNRPQLIQVLINLILNAFDALEAVPRGKREVLVSAAQAEDQHVHVAVRDTGDRDRPQNTASTVRRFRHDQTQWNRYGPRDRADNHRQSRRRVVGSPQQRWWNDFRVCAAAYQCVKKS